MKLIKFVFLFCFFTFIGIFFIVLISAFLSPKTQQTTTINTSKSDINNFIENKNIDPIEKSKELISEGRYNEVLDLASKIGNKDLIKSIDEKDKEWRKKIEKDLLLDLGKIEKDNYKAKEDLYDKLSILYPDKKSYKISSTFVQP